MFDCHVFAAGLTGYELPIMLGMAARAHDNPGRFLDLVWFKPLPPTATEP